MAKKTPTAPAFGTQPPTFVEGRRKYHRGWAPHMPDAPDDRIPYTSPKRSCRIKRYTGADASARVALASLKTAGEAALAWAKDTKPALPDAIAGKAKRWYEIAMEAHGNYTLFLKLCGSPQKPNRDPNQPESAVDFERAIRNYTGEVEAGLAACKAAVAPVPQI
jgi:hypothetical protein